MLTRKSGTQKARETMHHVVAYADDLAHDGKARKDLRSALEHGVAAARRLGIDARIADISSHLADDEELRRNVRSMLDDFDRAAARARRRSSHRLRKAVLVIAGGSGLVLVALPRARKWVRVGQIGTARVRSSSEPLPV